MNMSSRFPILPISVLAVAFCGASSAHAEDPNCPPGNWFCDTPPVPSGSASPPQAPPSASPSVSPAPKAVPPATQPPMLEPMDAPEPPRFRPLPRPKVPVWYRNNEIGINLHFGGVILGKPQQSGASSSEDRGMFGGGLGFRFRPVPFFALQSDFDYFSGRDYSGNQRTEYASSVSALAFLTPRSPAQLYLSVGAGWSRANVKVGETTHQYAYFGGQLGFGLEYRISRYFAFNGELRGFIRGRVDANADAEPEFQDDKGRTTNTSGGGILILGTTVYF